MPRTASGVQLTRRPPPLPASRGHGMKPAVRGFGRLLVCVLITAINAACQSLPPVLTGITIFPSDASGQPRGDDLCRTLARAPIPVIGVRPGADPQQSALFLN